jgi:hypothetical protein
VSKILILITILFLFSACSHKTVESVELDDRKSVSLGVMISTDETESGLKVLSVLPYTSASRAKLEMGDVIVGINDEHFTEDKKITVEKFVSLIKSFKIGDHIKLQVRRKKYFQKDELALPFSRNSKKELEGDLIEVDVKLEGRNWNFGDSRANFSKLPKRVTQIGDFKDKIEELLNPEIHKDTQELLNRFDYMSSLQDERRLPIVSYLQKNPFQVDRYQNEILKVLQNCKANKEIWNCLRNITNFSGIEILEPDKIFSGNEKTPADFLQTVRKNFKKSEFYLNKAFDNLTSSELKLLKNNAYELTDKFETLLYLSNEENEVRRKSYITSMNLLQKINMSYVIQSLLVYENITSQEFLNRLRKSVSSEVAKRNIVEEIKTSDGIFLIGGTGNNNYFDYANDNVKFIFDLGGDDFYPDISANIIDFSGNDKYESSRNWNLNSGFFRTRLLYDFTGNDVYISAKGGIASSFCGASLLLDLSGDDKYISQTYSMGTAWTGFSVLVDVSGNDSYQSTMLSQAVGIAGGLGYLLDFKEDDTYFSKGAFPSGYDDAGQFNGWSQGVGLGLRNFVSGGWGLLYDRDGKDNFEAGTFSQGGGYYFGLGSLINDGEENDFYSGGRYCQGFTAHYAVGTFLEIGGDDQYYSPSPVGVGIAWDLSLSYFKDLKGNDNYNQPGHYIGAANHNSFAFFIDEQGQDNYAGLGLPHDAKSNDYHGGKSLGLFWDRGHGKDQYKNLSNNSVKILSGWQVLIDE